MRSRSGIEFSDVAAATFVVGKDLIEADFLTIQEALDNLPPDGGMIFVLEGIYSIASTISITKSGTRIVGSGSKTVIRKAAGLAIGISAVGKDDITLSNIRFEADPATPNFQSTEILVYFETCNNVIVRDCQFYSLNVGGKPTMFSQLYLNFCNYSLVAGCLFQGAVGQGTSANGDATGTVGVGCKFESNTFLDFVDTGLGLLTNCRDCIAVGNNFKAWPVASGLSTITRVSIDVAGAQNPVIISNQIVGSTNGIRVLTNLVYTNLNVLIEANSIRDQEGTGTEPPQCVKVTHADAQEMSLYVKNNYFRIVGVAYATGTNCCVTLVSTNTTGVLIAEIDGNVFDGADAVGRGFTAQGLAGAGRIRFVPGVNYFKLAGTPITTLGAGGVTFEVADHTRNRSAQQGASWATLNFNNAATVNVMYTGRYSPGVYAVRISFGAMTDVAAGVNGFILGNGQAFDQSLANTTVEKIEPFNADADTDIEYTSHPAGNNYTVNDISINRLV